MVGIEKWPGTKGRQLHYHDRIFSKPKTSARNFFWLKILSLSSTEEVKTLSIDAKFPFIFQLPPTKNLLGASSGRRKYSPAYLAADPSSSSIRRSWLYLANRSDRQGAPVLICIGEGENVALRRIFHLHPWHTIISQSDNYHHRHQSTKPA